VATLLQQQRNNPALEWRAVKQALKALREPLPGAYLKDLRAAFEAYQREGDPQALLEAVAAITAEAAAPPETAAGPLRALQEEDLHLVCWEYIWS
jgi:signal transduction protein with GAF and PtsI domain